ncbi:MAG: hypothetical protein AAB436_03345 [Patescibacteria group bacterium]
MTRFLSESLQAPEPFFRLGLRRLESANGNPNTDIRFSAAVKQDTLNKLRSLGLDPNDTTAEELYHVLQERIKADDACLTRTLRTHAATHVSAEGDVVSGMIHVLKELPDSKRCFSIKSSTLKALLKRQPPKKALKQLGYRSVDSFLKHEVTALALASAWLVEGASWQSRFVDQYKKLGPSDFENRNIIILQPTSARWQKLATEVVEQNKHNLLSFKELGALIFLPLPKKIPEGVVTASLSLGLHELNKIRASSTYLQLCQVRADFGKIVQSVAQDEPYLRSELLDQPVPWHLVQDYYSRFKDRLSEDIFEPHIQRDDISWHQVERTLSSIEPSLEFWHQSGHLGLVRDGKPVSLNIVDAALNLCNSLPFEQRIVHYFQRSLWHELLLNYMGHESVERAVISELSPQLATETAMA